MNNGDKLPFPVYLNDREMSNLTPKANPKLGSVDVFKIR